MKNVGAGILIIFLILFIVFLAVRNIQLPSIFQNPFEGNGGRYEQGFRRPQDSNNGLIFPELNFITTSSTSTPASPGKSTSGEVRFIKIGSSPSYSSYGSFNTNQFLTLPSGLSPNAGKVRISTSNVGSPDPQTEYLALQNVSSFGEPPIIMAGWMLERKDGSRFTIPNAAPLAMNPGTDTTGPIRLKPGGIVIVSTGFSPRNQNFQTNKCTAYLEEIYDFIPSLATSCPRPDTSRITHLKDPCIVFLRSMGGCIALFNKTASLPESVKYDNACLVWITDHFSYAGCVNDYKNDPDFYSGEWRVWLNQRNEIWSNVTDNIILRDGQGKMVDMVRY